MNRNYKIEQGGTSGAAASLMSPVGTESFKAIKRAFFATLFALMFAFSANLAFADVSDTGEGSGSDTSGSDPVVEYEASYNGTKYETLADAAAAYKGSGTGAIILLKDVETSLAISGNNGTYSSMKIVLDGHNLASKSASTPAISVTGVELTVTNENSSAMGCVSAVNAPVIDCIGASVKTSVSLSGTVDEEGAAAGKTATAVSLSKDSSNSSSLTINEGTIDGAILTDESSSFSIVGGNFSSADYIANINAGQGYVLYKKADSADDEGATVPGRYEVVKLDSIIASAPSLVEIPKGDKTYKLYFENDDEASAYAENHWTEGVNKKTLINAEISFPGLDSSYDDKPAATYDGQAKEAKVVLSGVAKSDEVSATFEYRSGLDTIEAAENAGAYGVSVTGLTGEDASKYELRSLPNQIFYVLPASLKGAKLSLDAYSFVYNGKEQVPAVSSVTLGGTTLVEGTDFEVSYKRNGEATTDLTNAGFIDVVVTGKGEAGTSKGNYVGTASEDYEIAKLSIANAAVTLEEGTLTYNGQPQTKNLSSVALGEGDEVIEVSLDDVKVSGNTATNAGTHTITVGAKSDSNFTGSATVDFEIEKLSIDNAAVKLGSELTYNGKEQAQTVDKVTLTVGEGEEAIDVDVDLDSLEISGDTATDAGDYETLALTAKDDTNFTGQTSAQKFTIKPLSIEGAKVTLGDQLVYNAKEQEQELVSVVAGKGENAVEVPLESLKISDNTATDAGTYTLTIDVDAEIEANFEGSTTCEFTIDRLSIADATVTLGKVLTYSANEQIQTVDSIVVGEGEDAVTVPLEDVTISGNKATDADFHNMLITAKEKTNFKGYTKLSFEIDPLDVAGSKIELSKTSFTYNGKVQKPSIKSIVLNNSILKDGKDYIATAENSTKVGTYKVSITGTGSTYTGTASASYVINPKGVSKLKVSKAKKAFKVTWAKDSAERSGVQICYSKKKSMKSAKTVTVEGANAKAKTVKKLKKKTKYYVKVRSYKVVNGKTYYSSWSAKKAVKTK